MKNNLKKIPVWSICCVVLCCRFLLLFLFCFSLIVSANLTENCSKGSLQSLTIFVKLYIWWPVRALPAWWFYLCVCMCVHLSVHTVTPQGGSDWQQKRTDLNELWQEVSKVVRWNSSQALCRKLPHTKIGVPARTQQHDVNPENTITISLMNKKIYISSLD